MVPNCRGKKKGESPEKATERLTDINGTLPASDEKLRIRGSRYPRREPHLIEKNTVPKGEKKGWR